MYVSVPKFQNVKEDTFFNIFASISYKISTFENRQNPQNKKMLNFVWIERIV